MIDKNKWKNYSKNTFFSVGGANCPLTKWFSGDERLLPSFGQRLPIMPEFGELLKCLGQAVRETVDCSVLSDFVVEATPELAQAVWANWNRDAGHKRAEVEALARAEMRQVDDFLAQYLPEADGDSSEIDKAVATYLAVVPSSIRRVCRRLANPHGTALPPTWTFQTPNDLLALLPPRMPRFRPGDRPGHVGAWELVDLIDSDVLGETWKACDPYQPQTRPVAMRFFLHPAARKFFLGSGALLLDKVLTHGKIPGLLELQELHIHADPPCLQYEYVEAPGLTELVQEWQETQHAPPPWRVAALICQLADILGPMHRLTQPVVHCDLRPENILILPSAGEGWSCKIAGLGLGALQERLSSRGADNGRRNLYTSPQLQHGDPPNPRDDIFALGVLWYQLLTGNLAAGRPGGSLWRRRLLEKGLSDQLLEVLESCLEDEPANRPADAAALAAQLADLLPKAMPVKTVPPAVAAGAQPATAQASSPGQVAQASSLSGERSRLLANSIGLRLMLLPGGNFLMGSPEQEQGRRINEGPQHQVVLTRPYYLGIFPVTQGQYLQLMGQNPAHFQPGKGGALSHPVESVSWEDAVEFCRRLTELPEERRHGRLYRLPTEAEWEYACRAGSTTPFSCGSSLGFGQANFDTNFPYGDGEKGTPLQRTCPVNAYPANKFGLYDLHGNVWEWCASWLGNFLAIGTSKHDPQGPAHGQFRVIRGGSWRNHAVTCRSAYRNGLAPSVRDICTGFRVAMMVNA